MHPSNTFKMFNFNLNFLDTKYFGTSYLKEKKILHWSHIAQTFLAIIVIIFTIVRIGTKNVSSRADTWTMSVGFKTLVVLLYIVLTHRVEKLKRFASLKADMILSSESALFSKSLSDCLDAESHSLLQSSNFFFGSLPSS